MIKKIYTFGTSCTAGGGFEFDCNYVHFNHIGNTGHTRGEHIKNIYSEEPYTQEHYSYPGQLSTLLKNTSHNINVKNISKQGYGNERIERKFFELIYNDDNFKKNESLFIFEFSDLSRKEFYYNPLNNHLIMNYKADPDDSDMKNMTIAKSYWYDSYEDYKTITKDYEVFKEFRTNFISTDNQLIEITRKYYLFLEYLKFNNFNFLISAVPEILHINYLKEESKWNDYIIPFGFDNDDTKYNSFNLFADDNNLTIAHETSNGYGDQHPSLFANKIIAKMVYNEMIRKKYITGDVIPIPNKINFEENLKRKIF